MSGPVVKLAPHQSTRSCRQTSTGDQLTTNEDSSQADVRESVASLIVCRHCHNYDSNKAKTKTDNCVNAALAEVVAGPHETKETYNTPKSGQRRLR